MRTTALWGQPWPQSSPTSSANASYPENHNAEPRGIIRPGGAGTAGRAWGAGRQGHGPRLPRDRHAGAAQRKQCGRASSIWLRLNRSIEVTLRALIPLPAWSVNPGQVWPVPRPRCRTGRVHESSATRVVRDVAATLELNTRVQAFGEGDIVCGRPRRLCHRHSRLFRGWAGQQRRRHRAEGPPLPPPR